ncbi:hypothetical protein J4409_02885 [Candidatus Woesearchaeota archaeon]|nr:hypothetical protein [Candidatus Woesearchaeota archaeon]
MCSKTIERIFIKKGWNIKYLLSVKPSRTDCYLFHFATVEHTKELAKILEIKHILVGCDIADPVKEAEIVKNVVINNKVDAVVLGGVGLQETQIRSLQNALLPFKIEVFASHAGLDSYDLLKEMISRGYEIIITEIASDGLTEKHLGFRLNNETFDYFNKLSQKYGFEILGEGGYYNSLVVDGPIFKKKLAILNGKKVMNGSSGYLEVSQIAIINKPIVEKN